MARSRVIPNLLYSARDTEHNGALVLQGDQRERLTAWLGTRGFTRIERGN